MKAWHTAFVILLLLFVVQATPPLVHAQNLNNTPWLLHVVAKVSSGADGVKFGDANKDGKMDIATGWEGGSVSSVSLNPGIAAAKGEWPTVVVGKALKAEDAVFADIDGDGNVDVVSSTESEEKEIIFHWAPPLAQITDPSAWKTTPLNASRKIAQWMYAEPLQIDGKNGIDLVAGSKGIGASLGWFESPANPRDTSAWIWHKLRDVRWIMSIELRDMDGDGDTDILYSDRAGKEETADGGGSQWLENPGTAQATQPWLNHQITKSAASMRFLATGDLDNDGLIDVVTAADDKVILSRRLSSNGLEWAETVVRTPGSITMAKGVAITDVNNDGKKDIMLSSNSSQDDGTTDLLIWMSYDTAPFGTSWSSHTLSGVIGVKSDQLRLLDADGDGDQDVFTTEEKYGGIGIIWFENPFGGNGNDTEYKTADINHDGRVNILDYSILSTQFLREGDGFAADLNNDAIVNMLDLSILVRELDS